jgi:hypothetical protein
LKINIKAFLYGVAKAFDLFGVIKPFHNIENKSSSLKKKVKTNFVSDKEAIENTWIAVGNDMRLVMGLPQYTKEMLETYNKSCQLVDTFNVMTNLYNWKTDNPEKYKKVIESSDPAEAYLLTEKCLPLPGLHKSDMLALLLAVGKINSGEK